jgi:hypothetical protein
MKMDEVELLRRTCVNMKQIDDFFNGKEYQALINMAITLAQSNNKNSAEYLLAQVDLLDASIDFFTNKKEWKRCYYETVKLVTILRMCIDTKYKPA